MKKNPGMVYQFKITLKNIKPSVWRRILVPEDYTFWDLHVAIQDSMGWLGYHLHEFAIINPETGVKEAIGMPDEDGFGGIKIYHGWKRKITKYFSLDNPKAKYVYDFGDDWSHAVVLEKILHADEKVKYPVCIAGKRACPPEDCGGPWGYEDLLAAITDPKHERHEELLEWVGEEFDPEDFDPEEVYFGNPEERLKMRQMY